MYMYVINATKICVKWIELDKMKIHKPLDKRRAADYDNEG